MPRYALKIEYHGAPFVGWQRQIGLKSVQGCIETAIRALEADHQGIVGAGRTDTGVHGLGQVASFDMTQNWEPFRLSEALNFHLKPEPISIVAAARVEDDFHARFSATERQYLFRLVARRAPLTHDKGLCWQVRNPLDADAMATAARFLLGQHDFTTFRSTICQANSPLRTLDQLDVTEHAYAGGVEYRFVVRARSFLHNQVRSFVGTLERVGAGTWHPDDVKAALEAKDRAACGPVCPPHGLYLADVGYPNDPFSGPQQ